jgi:UDP-N-acetylglucosamine transferase subunit ALG13
MIPDKYVDLIHRAVFDTVTDKERRELEAYVEKNPGARSLLEDMGRMAGMMKEETDVEPPANLRKRIMNLVEAKQHEMARVKMVRESGVAKSERTERGIVMAEVPGRKPFSRRTGWLIGGGIAIVAVVLVVAFLYQPPSQTDVRGTIGGAERASKYRAGQIADADVVLENPEFQQLLQNDKVQDLVKSPEFQNLMGDAAFLELLNEPAFVQLMSDQKFLAMMGDTKVAELMSDAKYAQSMQADGANLAQLMSDESFAEMMGAIPKMFAEGLRDQAFLTFATDAKAVGLLKDMPKEALDVLANAAVLRLLSNDTYRTLANDPAMAALLAEPELIQLMSEQKFQAHAAMAKKLVDLNDEARFAQLMNQTRYAALASEQKAPQLLRLLGSSDFMALMSASAYKQMNASQVQRLAQVITDRAVLAFLDAPKINAIMQDRPWRFLRMFSNPAVVGAVADAPKLVQELADQPRFVAAMNEPKYRAALADHQAQMATMLSNFKFRQVLASQNTCFQAVMDHPTLRAVMLSEQKMPMMMADKGFMQIMSQPKMRQQFYEDMAKMAR